MQIMNSRSSCRIAFLCLLALGWGVASGEEGAAAAQKDGACAAKKEAAASCPASGDCCPAQKIPECCPIPEKAKRSDKKGGEVLEPIQEPSVEQADLNEMRRAARKVLLEEGIARSIQKLGGSEWEAARDELFLVGKDAVPFLIQALKKPETDPQGLYAAHAYQLGNPRRYTTQRPLCEVAYEVLRGLIVNHSDFKGELPGRDQALWQAFWEQNGAQIVVGKRAQDSLEADAR